MIPVGAFWSWHRGRLPYARSYWGNSTSTSPAWTRLGPRGRMQKAATGATWPNSFFRVISLVSHTSTHMPCGRGGPGSAWRILTSREADGRATKRVYVLTQCKRLLIVFGHYSTHRRSKGAHSGTVYSSRSEADWSVSTSSTENSCAPSDPTSESVSSSPASAAAPSAASAAA